MKRTILVFGSFDMLHRGHRYFLERSREYGERMRVVLARDEEIFQFKQRYPAQDFAQRKAALLESGLADEVVRSDLEHGTFYVLRDRPAGIVLGDGQEALAMALEDFFRAHEAVRCPVFHVAPHRRELHSSTRRHQLRLFL
ncbi:MAG: adenylyltransferase/cytidyltransferase family protein, partial [Spirochaetota bacterium]